MPFSDFLIKKGVVIDTTATSKTAVLLKVSQVLHNIHPQLSIQTLFDAYWNREALGSTTIGFGGIIPHVRSDLLHKPSGCFLRLMHPVDFGADDKQPIDLVIALIVPKHQPEQHLQKLNQIIQQFNSPSFRNACRKATTCDDLCALLFKNIAELATSAL